MVPGYVQSICNLFAKELRANCKILVHSCTMFESDSPSPGCSEANTPTLRTQLSLEVLIMFLYVSDLCRDQSFIRPSPVQQRMLFRIVHGSNPVFSCNILQRCRHRVAPQGSDLCIAKT